MRTIEGIKVVAVDDNADARELLKVILERSKAQTVVVSSGQAALEARHPITKSLANVILRYEVH